MLGFFVCLWCATTYSLFYYIFPTGDKNLFLTSEESEKLLKEGWTVKALKRFLLFLQLTAPISLPLIMLLSLINLFSPKEE